MVMSSKSRPMILVSLMQDRLSHTLHLLWHCYKSVTNLFLILSAVDEQLVLYKGCLHFLEHIQNWDYVLNWNCTEVTKHFKDIRRMIFMSSSISSMRKNGSGLNTESTWWMHTYCLRLLINSSKWIYFHRNIYHKDNTGK